MDKALMSISMGGVILLTCAILFLLVLVAHLSKKIKNSRFGLYEFEKLLPIAKKAKKDSNEGYWWITKALYVLSAKNTIRDDILTEAKTQEARAKNAAKKATDLRARSEAQVEALNQQAKTLTAKANRVKAEAEANLMNLAHKKSKIQTRIEELEQLKEIALLGKPKGGGLP